MTAVCAEALSTNQQLIGANQLEYQAALAASFEQMCETLSNIFGEYEVISSVQIPSFNIYYSQEYHEMSQNGIDETPEDAVDSISTPTATGPAHIFDSISRVPT